MKLVSCHIAGFGKFVNRAFDLSQNIVLVKAENGWGKTTLAVFLESMFFGLDSGRSKAISSNDRIKYEPWTGGTFGGSLVFIYADKTYRIERTFGKTPSADTARLYDRNHMLCYDFGEKAERLGESIFGMDRESYRKSVYIPQGSIGTGGLPDTMKNRLLTLLNTSSAKDNGALGAVERLENAERALRAKRRPAKGKLDEIDERLEYLARQKDDCAKAAQAAGETELLLRAQSRRIAEISQQLELVFANIKRCVRNTERTANLASRADLQEKISQTERTLNELNAFFGTVAPATVNTDGLQNAVVEFYALKTELSQLSEKLDEANSKTQEMESVKAQLSASRKTLESFEILLAATNETEGAGKRSLKEKKKKARKKGYGALFGVILFLALSLFGTILAGNNPYLGFSLLVVGVAGICVCFVSLLKRAGKKEVSALDFEDETLSARYAAARAECAHWQEKLSAFPPRSEEERERLAVAFSAKKDRMTALETGIWKFLQNFRFGEIYDYRAALETLKENAAKYQTLTRALEEDKRKLSQLSTNERPPASGEEYDLEREEKRRAGLEGEKERLTAERAKTVARLEEEERRAAQKSDYEAEESLLLREKDRLEKRLTAVKTAKELLIRARENVALRYLSPVERNCRKYAEILGFRMGADALRFAADGVPVFEVNGSFRSADYYSEGMKDLLGFCIRVALAEAMFEKEPPALILDDPFTELDDEKTEKAKRLVKKLAEKYQIVYFTCKSERTL